ncbi:MAG: hypothetical protein D6785_05640, partial [Planctomycetota bacterium]
ILDFVKKLENHKKYRGILRGPVGTLWTNGGSYCDRISLLGALLKASGTEVRYVGNEKFFWLEYKVSHEWKVEKLGKQGGENKWVKKEIPSRFFHQMEIKLDDQMIRIPLPHLVETPLLLSYTEKKWTLESVWKRKQKYSISQKWNPWIRPNQIIHFTYLPFEGTPVKFHRLLYTREYMPLRPLNHPSNIHLISLHSSLVPSWVWKKEQEVWKERLYFPKPLLTKLYLMLLDYQRQSDMNLKYMNQKFKIFSYFTCPRTLIASYYGGWKGEEPYLALDLRKNRVVLDGKIDKGKRHAFYMARSILEAKQEGDILKKYTRHTPLTAFILLDRI